MSDKMPVSKDRSRSEREKLRGLPFKEKIEYIWHYYNFHIIGAVIVIAIIINIVSAAGNPGTGLFIAWESPYVGEENLVVIGDTLTQRLFDEQDKLEAVAAQFYPTGEGQYYEEFSNIERLMAMLGAGAIDIFIIDYDTLCDYSEKQYLLPLDNILAEIKTVNPAVYDIITGNTVTAQYGPEAAQTDSQDITDELMGINITDAPLFKELGISFHTDAYLCIAISASNLYNAGNAIIELYK